MWINKLEQIRVQVHYRSSFLSISELEILLALWPGLSSFVSSVSTPRKEKKVLTGHTEPPASAAVSSKVTDQLDILETWPIIALIPEDPLPRRISTFLRDYQRTKTLCWRNRHLSTGLSGPLVLLATHLFGFVVGLCSIFCLNSQLSGI